MTFLGIDASLTATGLVIVNSKGEPSYWAYPSQWSRKYYGAGKTHRLTYYRKVLIRAIKKHRVTFAGLEDYAYGHKNSSLSFSIGELGGIIKQVLDELEIPVIKISVSQLKMFAGKTTPTEMASGKGRCWKCGKKIVKDGKDLVCRACGEVYTPKSDVLKFVKKELGYPFPWEPLRFSKGPGLKTKARSQAEDKVNSDLADAYVLARIIYYYNKPDARRELNKDQLSVMGLIREEK